VGGGWWGGGGGIETVTLSLSLKALNWCSSCTTHKF